jgi:hypothetical protein
MKVVRILVYIICATALVLVIAIGFAIWEVRRDEAHHHAVARATVLAEARDFARRARIASGAGPLTPATLESLARTARVDMVHADHVGSGDVVTFSAAEIYPTGWGASDEVYLCFTEKITKDAGGSTRDVLTPLNCAHLPVPPLAPEDVTGGRPATEPGTRPHPSGTPRHD